jgi:hypothetical protein
MQTNVDFPPKTESFSSTFGSYILHICVVRKMMKYKKCTKDDIAFCEWYIIVSK